jgi:hypothetical protein
MAVMTNLSLVCHSAWLKSPAADRGGPGNDEHAEQHSTDVHIGPLRPLMPAPDSPGQQRAIKRVVGGNGRDSVRRWVSTELSIFRDRRHRRCAHKAHQRVEH